METSSFRTKKFLIIIAGPTASGKTALAISLAKAYKCEIFSADSRQIYKEMNIGTAKPTNKELIEVKHHFINYKNITEIFDVGQYVADLSESLNVYFMSHNVAVLVGGTGLYIHSFLYGLDDFPEVDGAIINELEDVYCKAGIIELQKLLKLHDPVSYTKLDLHNSRRIIRALSVSMSCGKPYSSFLENKTTIKSFPFEIVPILLNPDRDVLYERINQRVDEMVDQGLVKEVEALYPMRHLRSLDTVGYRELFQFFERKISMQEAVDKIKINSRRYAKRQVTWFRQHGHWNQFNEIEDDKLIHWVNNYLN